MINVLGRYLAYSGEVDLNGKACGRGVATLLDDPNIHYKGTFLNDQIHGITVYTNHGKTQEYECKENRCFGK